MNPPSSVALTERGLEVEGRVFAGTVIPIYNPDSTVYPIGTLSIMNPQGTYPLIGSWAGLTFLYNSYRGYYIYLQTGITQVTSDQNMDRYLIQRIS